jgi:photosystem II stability/assembly factor-like uncharacterized protein
MIRILLLGLVPLAISAQTWVAQESHTTESLRGVSAANSKVVWASGTQGVYLKTTDGGASWQAATVPGAESLDFRDVHAVDERTAYLLSIGTGDKSRIYKTTDGGAHWMLQLTNPDSVGFFDQFAFWDATHGILIGDPVDGRLVIMTTTDGGKSWQKQQMPPALTGEGSFAASGTGIVVLGKNNVWAGSGGPGAARVFSSKDRGLTWTVAATPVRNDSASAGIFSLAFSDPQHGIAVGGDYTKADDATGNVAITSNGGQTWTRPSGPPPSGFRSAVTFLADRKAWIAVGPSGCDVSLDGGQSWKPFDKGGYNAGSFVSSEAGWAVGPRGRIARFQWK